MPYHPFLRMTLRSLVYALVLFVACELLRSSARARAGLAVNEESKIRDDSTQAKVRSIGERLEVEAEQLKAEQRLESSYAALEKLEQAAKRFQVANARRAELGVLRSIGQLHQRLDESQEAFTSFNQALALSRRLKAVLVEIDLLNDIGQLAVDLGDGSRALNYGTR